MGIGGDILKGIAKEATRDITKEFDENLSEPIKERKRNELHSTLINQQRKEACQQKRQKKKLIWQ